MREGAASARSHRNWYGWRGNPWPSLPHGARARNCQARQFGSIASDSARPADGLTGGRADRLVAGALGGHDGLPIPQAFSDQLCSLTLVATFQDVHVIWVSPPVDARGPCVEVRR